MALHTKTGFAKLCGMTPGNLSNYIKRGKVVCSGQFVDDQYPFNRLFLEHRRAFNADKSPASAEMELEQTEDLQVMMPQVMDPDPGIPDPPNIQDPDEGGDDSGESVYLLTKKKLKAEIEKSRRQIALLRIRSEKLNAVVIPTDLARGLLAQHCRSISAEFKNSIAVIIAAISKRTDLTAEEQASIRGQLLTTINRAISNGMSESNKSIDNIIREFMEKREVGEREGV